MSAGWVFTVNNYRKEDMRALKMFASVRANKIVYMIFGKEVGESGTPHLQGYVHFEGRKRFSTVKKFLDLSQSPHIEPMRGTPQQASTYCKKDGEFWEHGELPEHEPGKRNELQDIKNKIEGGASTDEIGRVDAHFGNYVRYNRGFRSYEDSLVEPRAHKSQVVVFYGEPGTFKSYAASRFKNSYEVVRPTGKHQPVWFDGYNPREHTTVCFDDFYGWMPYHNLLQICDRYQCRVQAKGHTKQFRPSFVVFTSNSDPADWYKAGAGINYAALERRLDFVAEHSRADAPNDAMGIELGDILIRVHRGHVACHPLYRYMKPVSQDVHETLFKLDMPMFDEDVLDTQLDEEALVALYSTALVEGFSKKPEAEPPLVDDSQPDITASQKAFIDLCESSNGSRCDEPPPGYLEMDGAEEIDSDDSGSYDLSDL